MRAKPAGRRTDGWTNLTSIDEAAGKPGKVLVVAVLHWPFTSRLCLEMAHRGLAVHVLAPAHHALHRLDGVTTSRLGRSRRRALSDIVDTIMHEQPGLVIPGDDPACACLLAVEALCAQSRDPARRRIGNLIEQSLGPATGRALGLLKSRFVDIARREGIRIPHSQPVPDLATLRRCLAGQALPAVLKLDASHGGQGVRVIDDHEAAERALADLKWWAGSRRLLGQAANRLGRTGQADDTEAFSALTLQAFVPGVPANRAVFCWQGEVQAGISVEAVQTLPANGPASVVKLIDSPEMRTAAEHMVRRLALSGFVGFDFIRTGEGDVSYLLEMNARPTPICHWAPGPSQDLIGALKEVLCGNRGEPVAPQPTVGAEGTIALFPQELWRDPTSPHLRTAVHDRPDHLSALVATYGRPLPEDPLWLSEVRTRMRRGDFRPGAG